jgi:hypothetical protein
VIEKPISSKLGSSPAPAAEPTTVAAAMAAIKKVFFMAISSLKIETFAPRLPKRP